MPSDQEARALADKYSAALNSQDVDAILALCSDDVEWSGILVRKVTGEASGTLTGKEALRPFLREMLGEFAGPGQSFVTNRLGNGIRSVFIEGTVSGIIPTFTVLVLNTDGKITQVLVHQEVM